MVSSVLNAAWNIGGATFKGRISSSEVTSVSNGGTLEDYMALRDGVGVKIFMVGDSGGVPDFSNINNALSEIEEGESANDGNNSSVFAQDTTREEPFVDPSGIVHCYNNPIGSFIEVEGTQYLVVDDSLIRQIMKIDLDSSQAERICTSNVTDLNSLFYGNNPFPIDPPLNISQWDVSRVTNFAQLFAYKNISGDLSQWDTSAAIYMNAMFWNAPSFNGDISNWNVSNVTNFSQMFWGASSFNNDLSRWNTSSAQNMGEMFREATNFNSDLSQWNVSGVSSMEFMFYKATNFNGDISQWNVFSVTNMDRMFAITNSFNQDISAWDISNVINLKQMFTHANGFNQDLSSWTTKKNPSADTYNFAVGASSWDLVNQPAF